MWVGGASVGAPRRVVSKGDGWHGNVTPDQAGPIVARLRKERPEESFTVSMRTAWDGIDTPENEMVRDADAFRSLGVDHVVAMPAQGDLSTWLRSVEELWRILSPFR
jgi:hypothetical protein